MAKQQQRKDTRFSSVEKRINEHGVGFLVHKDIVNTVMGCRPVSSRFITIRLRVVHFNITVVQVYAPTSDYDDNEIEKFYDQLQNTIGKTPKEDKHEQGVGFLAHKDIVNTVMGCRPVSSRLHPFNITKLQKYAPTSDNDEDEIEEFYDQLQNVIDQIPKKDILVAQRGWNTKVGKDACGNWQGICGPFCNDDTNERGLRLLEFATFNDLVLANTFGHHKASRRWTWHSPNGQHHNQIGYTLVRKRLRSGVNSART